MSQHLDAAPHPLDALARLLLDAARRELAAERAERQAEPVTAEKAEATNTPGREQG